MKCLMILTALITFGQCYPQSMQSIEKDLFKDFSEFGLGKNYSSYPAEKSFINSLGSTLQELVCKTNPFVFAIARLFC